MSKILQYPSDPLTPNARREAAQEFRNPEFGGQPATTCGGNGCAQLEELLADFVPLVAAVIGTAHPYWILVKDNRAGEGSISIFPKSCEGSPARGTLHSSVVCQPRTLEKLHQGQHVLVNGAMARGETEQGASQPVMVFPVVCQPHVIVLLCVAPSRSDQVLPASEIETVRLLCRLAGAAALGQPGAQPQPPVQEPANLEQMKRDIQSIDHQMKAHLLSNVAHELRTPLVAVRGYTRMIMEGRSGDINSTQREYLTIVAENVNRLVALTDNLSRLTSSQQLHPEPFDMSALLRECLSLIAEQAAAAQIELASRIPPEPVRMVGDRGKLAQVLQSLLQNAVKYTEEGGEIRVEFMCHGEDEATLSISDTGPGIPEELLSQVFDTCRRELPAGTDRGILAGLARVHDVICLHGGRISVTGKPGCGSAFSITLPIIRVRDGL